MAAVLAADVGALLGDSAPTEAVLQHAVDAVTLMARAYTRNEGFDQGDDHDEANAEIAAAILTAACRLARNPGQLATSETMGPFTFDVRGGFQGFNLAELAALDRYRIHAL
ncbi:hypothetical protein H7J93_26140 [Mycobacterium barrassiae]|uniref:hypothetical protein n=1 Tax=Mycobacterium barrassiae TaxID=319709 RepID=UPI002265C199|nr:hypothetical protein [Mycobacterium barrassiae]MCV7303110.1 hypothetical protein [Mycobacterium barrassiae]